MTVYVDPICNHGWVLRGHPTLSCHLFNDTIDLRELHEIAARIGMKPSWFQAGSIPHYDLTPPRRDMAIEAGAVSVDRRQAVRLWRARRALVSK